MKYPTQKEFRFLTNRDQIGSLLNSMGLNGIGVEVGTFEGTYATAILSTWTGHLHCVDSWVNQPRENYHDSANLRVMDDILRHVTSHIGQHPRCTLHRLFSHEGAALFKDRELDFVFIDANHSLDAAKSDISLWWPKVKLGGVFSGHDFFTRYDDQTSSDVLTAVFDFMDIIKVRPHVTWDTSWWFIKTQENDEQYLKGLRDGRK